MKQCAVCGKGSIIRGARKKLRGNYNPTPKKRKQPNLQWMKSPMADAFWLAQIALKRKSLS